MSCSPLTNQYLGPLNIIKTNKFIYTGRNIFLTKHQFGKNLLKYMGRRGIKSGFRATEIFFYNPGAIPEESFAPSLVREQPYRNKLTYIEGHNQRQKTLSSQPSCLGKYLSLASKKKTISTTQLFQ